MVPLARMYSIRTSTARFSGVLLRESLEGEAREIRVRDALVGARIVERLSANRHLLQFAVLQPVAEPGHDGRIPLQELADFLARRLEGDHRVVERVHRDDVGARHGAAQQRGADATGVLDGEVGLGRLAERVRHEVVLGHVVTAARELAGRLPDHLAVP